MKAAQLDSMLKNVIESFHSDLQTLKQAVWQVSLRVARGTPHGATTDEDRVACTMSGARIELMWSVSCFMLEVIHTFDLWLTLPIHIFGRRHLSKPSAVTSI